MERGPVYLDNAATTAVLPEVVAEMEPYFFRRYGNPSSSHAMGVEAARAMERAAREIEKSTGGGRWNVIFTSTGTEANNLALLGYALKGRRGSVVTTAIEHPSVIEPAKHLKERPLSVTFVAPRPDGTVPAADLMKNVDDSTVLVSVQHANNEIGTVQPVEEIGLMLKKIHPDVLFHIDMVQTAGRIDLGEAARWADLATISAHKMHGPKGVGALLIRKGLRGPSPLLWGGGQQGGLRSGTENVPGASGLALAFRIASEKIHDYAEHMNALEQAFEGAFRETKKVRRMFRQSPHIPGFIVVGFEKVPSQVVENAMHREGFIVSSGAACSSRKARRSHVLDAVGCPEGTNVLRIVPSRFTTPGDMERAAAALNAILAKLTR